MNNAITSRNQSNGIFERQAREAFAHAGFLCADKFDGSEESPLCVENLAVSDIRADMESSDASAEYAFHKRAQGLHAGAGISAKSDLDETVIKFDRVEKAPIGRPHSIGDGGEPRASREHLNRAGMLHVSDLGVAVDIVKAQIKPPSLGKLDQLGRYSRRDGLSLFIEGDVALSDTQLGAHLDLRQLQLIPDRLEGGHAPIISHPDDKSQQSDCLEINSRAYIVRRMPAKPLSAEQKADAARLKAIFKAWQSVRKAKGEPSSQDVVSEELGFGQSALSQYLNATIPLNADALRRFCTLMGVAPGSISPGIVQQELARVSWLAPAQAEEKQVVRSISPSSKRAIDEERGSFHVGKGVRSRTAGLVVKVNKPKKAG